MESNNLEYLCAAGEPKNQIPSTFGAVNFQKDQVFSQGQRKRNLTTFISYQNANKGAATQP